MLPFKSIDAASVTGPGLVRDVEDTINNVTMLVKSDATAGPGVSLEASMDNSDWRTVLTSSSPNTVMTSGVSKFRYWRANITSMGNATSIDVYLAF